MSERAEEQVDATRHDHEVDEDVKHAEWIPVEMQESIHAQGSADARQNDCEPKRGLRFTEQEQADDEINPAKDRCAEGGFFRAVEGQLRDVGDA